MFSSPPPFSFTPSSLYQGFLAFRRRCGETLQDSCCPPGACGPSPNPPPVTLPLPQHPRPEILQDPLRSSKIPQDPPPQDSLPPTALFRPSHCTLGVLAPTPNSRPTCRPLKSATAEMRVKVILVVGWLCHQNISYTALFSHNSKNISREENFEPIYNVDSTSKILFLFSQSLLGFSAD